jgi:hypothetical protein
MDSVPSSELGRELAKRRARYDKQCEVCGAAFKGLKWSRYCKPTCKQKGWQRAKALERRHPADQEADS